MFGVRDLYLAAPLLIKSKWVGIGVGAMREKRTAFEEIFPGLVPPLLRIPLSSALTFHGLASPAKFRCRPCICFEVFEQAECVWAEWLVRFDLATREC